MIDFYQRFYTMIATRINRRKYDIDTNDRIIELRELLW